MSVTYLSIHDVVSIKLKSVDLEKDATWRDLQIKTSEGHHFTLTLFADAADNLKFNLKEAVD